MNAHAKDQELARLIRNSMPLAPNEYGRVLSERLPVEHVRTLRRAQMTLHRWSELQCGTGDNNNTWSVERRESDGKPMMRRQGRSANGLWSESSWAIPDREAGALRRVAAVCKSAGLYFFHQTDPRGCALYVAAFPLDHSNYDRGIACL